MNRLAIFDCDGTLVDSGAPIYAALKASLEQNGFDVPPPNESLRVIGLSLPEAMAALLPDCPPEQHRQLAGDRQRTVSRDDEIFLVGLIGLVGLVGSIAHSAILLLYPLYRRAKPTLMIRGKDEKAADSSAGALAKAEYAAVDRSGDRGRVYMARSVAAGAAGHL